MRCAPPRWRKTSRTTGTSPPSRTTRSCPVSRARRWQWFSLLESGLYYSIERRKPLWLVERLRKLANDSTDAMDVHVLGVQRD